jgi:hypothetical protein
MLSWANWSGAKDGPEAWLTANFADNLQRFIDYAEGYRQARERNAERLLVNQFERMCLQPEAHLRAIFAFIGLEFSSDFLQFSSKHFVYGHAVSTEYLYPYRTRLSAGLCERILDATAAYAEWHFHPE